MKPCPDSNEVELVVNATALLESMVTHCTVSRVITRMKCLLGKVAMIGEYWNEWPHLVARRHSVSTKAGNFPQLLQLFFLNIRRH